MVVPNIVPKWFRLGLEGPPNTLQTGGTVPRSRILRQNPPNVIMSIISKWPSIEVEVEHLAPWPIDEESQRPPVARLALRRVSCTLGHGNEFKSDASLSCFLFL